MAKGLDQKFLHYGITGAFLACIVLPAYDGTRGFAKGRIAKYGFNLNHLSISFKNSLAHISASSPARWCVPSGMPSCSHR